MTAPKRECTDATVLARLKQMAGHRYESGTLATYFGVSCAAMTARLRFMAANGVIQMAYDGMRRVYYWPSEADKLQDHAAALMTTAVRGFRPYRLPQAMRELATRLQAEREAIPSLLQREAA